MVNINFSKFAALFAYDLKSIAYKPSVGASSLTNLTHGVSARFVLPNDGSASFLQPAAVPIASSPTSLGSVQNVSTVDRRNRRGRGKRATFARDADGNSDAVDDVVTTEEASPQVNCTVEPYDPPPILNQEFPPYDQTSSNVFRYRQQQSVNLGSWYG